MARTAPCAIRKACPRTDTQVGPRGRAPGRDSPLGSTPARRGYCFAARLETEFNLDSRQERFACHLKANRRLSRDMHRGWKLPSDPKIMKYQATLHPQRTHRAGTRRATALLFLVLANFPAPAAELWIGAATTNITPDRPVALDGHRNLRISNTVESPLTATALVVESRTGDTTTDQATIVSCDIVAIRPGVLEKVRAKVQSRRPDIDGRKVFLCATHTHNAPVTLEGRYALPATGVMKPAEYVEFMTDRIALGIDEAWRKRQPGRVGWGQGQAVVAQNRRALYADGSAKMYGATQSADFRRIEAVEDHNLEVLFFWDAQDRLVATALNPPCPAQEAEGGLAIHADFWHPVRESLRARHGAELCILAWTGAGGDQTSRPMFGKAADTRMRKLRGLTRLQEVARRIVNGWEEAYSAAQLDQRAGVVLRHSVENLTLPHRQVTAAEVAEARQEAAKYARNPAQQWNYRWYQGVVERFEAQQAGTEVPFEMELHVLRLGDVAIATNPFELFTDYGIQMKARSPAVQTFVVQLTGSGGYLPTELAVRGGGYGAVIQSSRVGPDGGQMLVDRTVEAIRALWSTAQ